MADEKNDWRSKLGEKKPRGVSPDVARKILDCAARKNPPLRQAVTADARVFYLLRRLLPRALYHAALYRALPGINSWAAPEEQSTAGPATGP